MSCCRGFSESADNPLVISGNMKLLVTTSAGDISPGLSVISMISSANTLSIDKL